MGKCGAVPSNLMQITGITPYIQKLAKIIKMDILKDFDFSLFDLPEFKEDSVREEIIVPILKELGYSASGQYKIKGVKH